MVSTMHTCSNLSISELERETKLFDFVTGITTKPRLSRHMLPNINTCENGWSNFSANLRVVVIKLGQLYNSIRNNKSRIYCNFQVTCTVLGSVVMRKVRRRLSACSPVLEKSMVGSVNRNTNIIYIIISTSIIIDALLCQKLYVLVSYCCQLTTLLSARTTHIYQFYIRSNVCLFINPFYQNYGPIFLSLIYIIKKLYCIVKYYI